MTDSQQAAQFLTDFNYSPDGPTLYMGHRLLMDAALHLLFPSLPPEAQAQGEKPWNAEDLDRHFSEGPKWSLRYEG